MLGVKYQKCRHQLTWRKHIYSESYVGTIRLSSGKTRCRDTAIKSNMSALWKHCLIAISITAIIIPVIGKPCFITNCPPGGKRSNQLTASSSSIYDGSEQNYHQCVKCGPGGEGTCFGSNMCCGSNFGCFISTKETNICLLTNLTSPRPCNEKFWNIYLKATSCNLDDNDSLDGICVADRLCCSPLGRCRTNSACKVIATYSNDEPPVYFSTNTAGI